MQRVAIVGGAVVLGALVLLVALWAGGEAPARPERNVRDLEDVDAPALELEGVRERSLHDKLASSGRGRATLPSEDGTEFTELFWASSERRPQGVWAVSKPGVRIHIKPFRRVLQVQALEGTFNVPDEQVRGGRLRRNVVLTLFDGPADRVVDLSNDSPDIRLRLFLDEATFDLDLGVIESDSSVHATSAQFDFRGTGLRLNYNAARKRLERLEILQGQELRVRGDLFAKEQGTHREGNAAAEQGTARAGGDAASDDPSGYRATLAKEVVIENPQTRIEADQLAMIFELSGGEVSQRVFEQEAGKGGGKQSGATAGGGVGAGQAVGEALALEEMEEPPAPASLMTAAADDLRIAWAGPLVVTPHERSAQAAGGTQQDDVQLQLWGAPVRIVNLGEDAGTIEAGSVIYRSGSRVFELFEGLHQPVVVASPAMGSLSAQSMRVNQLDGTAVLRGAGELKAQEVEQVAEDDTPRLPPGMRITWQERVDLTFGAAEAGEGGGPLRLGALQSAMFRGDVAVRHPEFEMDTAQLALRFSSTEGTQGIEAIDALGTVRVWGKGSREKDELSMRSDALSVAMRPDERGRLRPAGMTAQGDVYAQQPGTRLWANLVELELSDEDEQADAAEASRAAMMPAVKRMTAQRNVRVEQAAAGVALTADRLVALVDRGQVDLYGAADVPVNVLTRDGMLTGTHVTMVEADRTLMVHGAGALTFVLADRNVPSGAGPVTFQPDPLRSATVRWSKWMRFDDGQGRASFTGDVVLDARNGHDTTHLEAQRLDLAFTSGEAESGVTFARPQAAIADTGSPLMERMMGGDRQIRSVVADGAVVFLNESWVDEPGQTLATRLRMAGPRLTFNHGTAQVRIEGEGSMLVQEERRKNAADDGAAERMAFTGHGATVFTWQGSLTLDAEKNDMTILDRVRMVHRPHGKEEVVRLDCATLVADLEETGGLRSWLGERGPQPAVVAIRADEAVRITSQKYEVSTDHLLYTGADETVLLWADEGGVTQVVQEDRPTPMSAARFRWDLRRDVIQIDSGGPGRAPVR